jgi:hypothetical protein
MRTSRALALVALAWAVGCAVSVDETLWQHADGASKDAKRSELSVAPERSAPDAIGEARLDQSGPELGRDQSGADLKPGEGKHDLKKPGDLKLADLPPATCPAGAFQCLPSSGTAQVCSGGSWKLVGTCALGCDAASKSCRRPSNVAATLVGKGTGEPDTAGLPSLTINTDTGAISPGVRPAGTGLDPTSGIHYEQVAQSGTVGLGVFAFKRLTVQSGTAVTVTGARALVVLATGPVVIAGTVSVAASAQNAGPGGFAGGAGGAKGNGPCPGLAGSGDTYQEYCTSGGGGGGHGGAGGAGGDSSCTGTHAHVGGAGGAACGAASLVPLVGGSGGAGGAVAGTASKAGPGGGGGGAIQISSAVSISVSGSIDAGGGGGGESVSAGGSGGGAGGAILLEAPNVSAALLAANGGGGGGGDCT